GLAAARGDRLHPEGPPLTPPGRVAPRDRGTRGAAGPGDGGATDPAAGRAARQRPRGDSRLGPRAAHHLLESRGGGDLRLVGGGGGGGRGGGGEGGCGPGPRPDGEAAGAACLTSGSGEGCPRQQKRRGEEVVVEAHWTCLQNADGSPAAVMTVAADITHARNL